LVGQLKSKKNEDHIHAGLTKPTFLKPVMSFVQEGSTLDEGFLFAKAEVTGMQEVVGQVFGPNLLLAEPGHSTTGFLPFAAPHSFLCIEGSFLVFAANHDDLPGFGYSSKREAFGQLSSEGLQAMLTSKTAIVLNMKPGDFVHVPAGMIVRQAALSQSVILKWAVFDTCPSETKTVLSCAMLYCSSFPELAQGAFSGWMKLLQERAMHEAHSSST
jgi:hypothetical protein